MTSKPSPARMPVLFVGHGSPMNVVEDNRWSRGFASLSGLVPKPKAILAISAHWFVRGTYLTGQTKPKTIHDFGGFPPQLYEIQYPARGPVELARRVRTLLGEDRASLSNEWGLDHGTWSVLRWMFPAADVPVLQLSIDSQLSAPEHYELGKALRALRSDGVLIVGSGNVVHNLSDALRRMGSKSSPTPGWAQRFDNTVAQALTERDTTKLLSLWPGTEDGQMAHPSPDHFWPLLYAYGATDDHDAVQFPTTGFDLGSISMRNVLFG